MAILDETAVEPRGAIRPERYALVALALTIPIAILVAAISFKIEPLETALKEIFADENDRPTVLGSIYVFGGLLALPVALAVSLWPVLRDGLREARRHLYIANLAMALVVLALMVPTWGAIAEEIYRCDVLRIPNCD